jgi:phosphate uptake regulator
MVHRSIIQLSPTTKVVSLPSQWLVKNKIKKGDYVNLEECNNQIIIETTKSNSTPIYSDLTKLTNDLMWTAIDSFYMLGYTQMQLKLTNSQKRLVTKIIKYFPMFIIESETTNILELKAVSNSLEIDFQKTLEHIRHMTSNMINEAIVLIEKKEWISLKDIKKIDYTINTYTSICFRYLNNSKIPNIVAWAQYVKILELYADRICILCNVISQSRTITKSDITLIKKINNLYNDMFKLQKDFSIEKINIYETNRIQLEKDSSKSELNSSFSELTRSIYDLSEIVFQLKQDTITP